jgi:hypothetical protein
VVAGGHLPGLRQARGLLRGQRPQDRALWPTGPLWLGRNSAARPVRGLVQAFPETETNPTATADAYLVHERCLDLRLLRGAYTQELYRDHKTGHTSATVRFQIGDTHWGTPDRPARSL